MELKQALELFLVDQEIRGNSQRTIEIYTTYIDYLINYIGNVDINTIKKQTIIDYQLYLLNRNAFPIACVKQTNEKKLSRFTVKTYLTHLRTFFRWLYNSNYMNENIFESYVFPKVPKLIKPIMSEEEIEEVLFDFSDGMLGCRNKCIFLLMLDSGLRVQEVPGLDINDVMFEQNRLLIRDSKGMKDRIVPITLYTKRELLKYLKFYRPAPDSIEEKSFFLSTDNIRITESAIKSLLFRIKKRLDLKKLNPHYLRHTFATRYIINGGDMTTLQMILGHDDIDTTRKYVHLANYYIKMDFDKYSSVSSIANKKNRKVK